MPMFFTAYLKSGGLKQRTITLRSTAIHSTGFNTLYYVLFCLFLSTCVLQNVCVHTMDFVSAHKQIN